MREESRSAVVRVPAEVLWDYLSDYDRVVRLGWADASARRMEDDGPCDARYKAHTTWEGVRSKYTACLDKAERPRTLTWSTKTGGASNWVRFDIDPIDAESVTLTVTLHLKHGAALRALEPFAWGLLRPAFMQTVERLEKLHEELGDTADPSGPPTV